MRVHLSYLWCVRRVHKMLPMWRVCRMCLVVLCVVHTHARVVRKRLRLRLCLSHTRMLYPLHRVVMVVVGCGSMPWHLAPFLFYVGLLCMHMCMGMCVCVRHTTNLNPIISIHVCESNMLPVVSLLVVKRETCVTVMRLPDPISPISIHVRERHMLSIVSLSLVETVSVLHTTSLPLSQVVVRGGHMPLVMCLCVHLHLHVLLLLQHEHIITIIIVTMPGGDVGRCLLLLLLALSCS